MTPQVHNQLRAGQLSGALTRALGDTRGDGGIERYGETLTPTMNLWSQPEWNYLRRDYLVSKFITSPAVAGEFSGIALVNPAGSGSIAVIEKALVWGGTTGQVVYMNRGVAGIWTATYAGTGGRGISRDSRIAYNVAPGFSDIYIGSDAGALGSTVGIAHFVTNMATDQVCGLPYVLTPGEGIAWVGNTVNVVLYLVLTWRERMAFRGELE